MAGPGGVICVEAPDSASRPAPEGKRPGAEVSGAKAGQKRTCDRPAEDACFGGASGHGFKFANGIANEPRRRYCAGHSTSTQADCKRDPCDAVNNQIDADKKADHPKSSGGPSGDKEQAEKRPRNRALLAAIRITYGTYKKMQFELSPWHAK
jgi:hypothetical protein